jgi:hemin uptake protein HemP
MSEPVIPSPTPDPPPEMKFVLHVGLRVWKSEELLGEKPEAIIVHDSQTYRLRCTRQGKLILYK